MRSYSIHHVDAFTSKPFEGNSSLVVFDAETLSETEMAKIAQEMNLSETVFVLPASQSTNPPADFRLRFLTKSGDEVKFCAHAAVAALFALAKAEKFGMTRPGQYQFHVQTNAGVVPLLVDAANLDVPLISYDLPQIDLNIAPYDHRDLADALGIEVDFLDHTKPVMIERTNNHVYFVTPSLKDLGKLAIDQKKAKEFAQKDRLVIFCALTPHTFDAQNQVHCRSFCPLLGIDEDPFTGSMQGGVAAYLFKHQMVDTRLAMIGSEQGHFVGRPGQVLLEIKKTPQFTCKLHARAVQLYSAKLTLP
ncbi:MAG: PhzF family phenazine biosynthesis protein [Chlamydiales bacterium]|nr:PhzF family phenazine biosynthesis protein [Chlamydiales bacterium]